jgi:hypothetical protein
VAELPQIKQDETKLIKLGNKTKRKYIDPESNKMVRKETFSFLCTQRD